MTRTVSSSGITNGDGYTTDALHLIETQTASSSSEIDLVLPSGYFKFQVVISSVVPSVDAAGVYMRFSADGGSSFEATSYQWANRYTGFSDGDEGSTSSTSISLITNLGSDANEAGDIDVTLINPNLAAFTRASFITSQENSSSAQFWGRGGGLHTAATAMDAVRFFPSSGNFESGTFKLYGWVS